jgi:hypothetical protein
LYKSTDYGKTWTNISNGIPVGSFTRVVREDDKRKDLLYAGTENGVYISFNGGKNWTLFQLNLPNTPITDLRVHQNNLIAATSGRSFWILDDLTLVRQYKSSPTTLSVYEPSPAILASGSSELDGNSPDFMEGSLRTRKWQDKDGNDRYTTEIRGDRMQMLGSRGGGGGGWRRRHGRLRFASRRQRAARQASPIRRRRGLRRHGRR